jgi:pimeloyl-ACP methyl ester carboxylesterase
MQGRTDVTPYLSKIQLPSLVVCGEEDKFTFPMAMKKMAEIIANSKFVTVPGAGHMSPVENSVFFNITILDFLKVNFS